MFANDYLQKLKTIKKINKSILKTHHRSDDHIITFSEFKQYLINKFNFKFSKDKNENQYRYLIKIYDYVIIRIKRFTDYYEPKSNKQFMSVYYSKNITYRNRLLEMLYFFMNNKNIELIQNKLKNKKSDKIIFDYIRKNANIKNNKQAQIYKMATIAEYINYYCRSLQKIKKPKILDVGVGSGKKIRLINSFVNSSIYGTDIETWGPYKKIKKYEFPFEFIKLDPYTIPFDNNSFDVILFILTLHHIDNLLDAIKEAKNKLKKNGYIIIVEHDVWDDNDNMIIDIQHNIYSNIYNEPYVKPGNYYNMIEWNMIFSKCGMKHVINKELYDDSSSKKKYDLQYIAIYQK